MSVLVVDRKESKWEPIVHAEELHDELLDLCNRNFGIKDLAKWLRKHYSKESSFEEEYEKYSYMLLERKKNIDHISILLTNNLKGANSTYPTNLHECEIRRDYLNSALVNCNQLIKELQNVIDRFDVDVNIYFKYSKLIDEEIRMIKGWRQKDNRFLRRLSEG